MDSIEINGRRRHSALGGREGARTSFNQVVQRSRVVRNGSQQEFVTVPTKDAFGLTRLDAVVDDDAPLVSVVAAAALALLELLDGDDQLVRFVAVEVCLDIHPLSLCCLEDESIQELIH